MGGGRKRKREKREGEIIVGREDGGWAVRVTNTQATHTQSCKKKLVMNLKRALSVQKIRGRGSWMKKMRSAAVGRHQNDIVSMNHCTLA